MPLEEYRRKRDFKRTPEPAGDPKTKAPDSTAAAPAAGSPPAAPATAASQPDAAAEPRRLYLIQKHAARQLHYDLRLEYGGVLLSWALPKGPSLDPKEKRLAVRVEDHPVEYGDFEGTIPAGEYGGGTVMLWDRGGWEPITALPETLDEGKLKLRIHGTKLQGAWALVRMGGRAGEGGKNWLFIKERDGEARSHDQAAITDRAPFSVVTSRSMEQIAAEGNLVWTGGGPRSRPAVAASQAPVETASAAPSELPDRLGIGELPGAQRRPLPSSPAVQHAAAAKSVPDGDDWLHEMLLEGQRLLCVLTTGGVSLQSPEGEDWTDRVPRVAVAAARLGVDEAILDGHVVLLDPGGVADGPGLQAAVQRGLTDALLYFAYDLLHAQGFDLRRVALAQRKALLARIVGERLPADAALRCSEHIAGHGETVYEQALQLGAAGIVSKRADSPYTGRRSRTWLAVRCPRRKNPGGFETRPYQARRTETAAGRKETGSEPNNLEASSETPERGADARAGGAPQSRAAQIVTAPACTISGVRLTHPDKVLYPEQRITKRTLALFAEAIADHALPHLVERPLSLYRCPQGVEGDGFFHKHLDENISPHLYGVSVAASEGGDDKPFITIKDAAGLVTLVQMDVLEVHPWGSRIDGLERPDRLILDLDPGPDVAWAAIAGAALQIREMLHILGLRSFVKTTGGKGLHVVVPLQRRADWDEVKRFAQSVAQFMVRHDPTRYVFTVSKAQRPRKIFVDYLRNTRGATAVAAYSTRARPGARVSAPLSWDELDPQRPVQFDVWRLLRRLARQTRDPWDGFFDRRQSLTAKMKEQLDAQK